MRLHFEFQLNGNGKIIRQILTRSLSRILGFIRSAAVIKVKAAENLLVGHARNWVRTYIYMPNRKSGRATQFR